MDNLIFSQLPFDQLTSRLSEAVFNRVAPLIQPIPTQTETEYLTRKQAGELLGVTMPTLGKWSKEGRIKAYRIASRVRYKRAELESSLSPYKTRR